jgi:hypothetical protein
MFAGSPTSEKRGPITTKDSGGTWQEDISVGSTQEAGETQNQVGCCGFWQLF